MPVRLQGKSDCRGAAGRAASYTKGLAGQRRHLAIIPHFRRFFLYNDSPSRDCGRSWNLAMKRPDFSAALRNLVPFALYCGRRFMSDGCLRKATQLSYALLLATVPVRAI